ncbi:MAG: ABC transporter substrate-binding protein [Anaerolineaceae bacterium]|nr:ABC transporter substrate-binding protein [Anaerolineaceae bacterium]
MTKRLFPLLLLLVALTALGGLGPALAQDNVLVMARSADTTGLDPHTQTAFASHRLLELIYEPLVELDAELNIIPALAESWAFNEDATSLTLNLREGVTFHDGSAMDSAEVRQFLAHP